MLPEKSWKIDAVVRLFLSVLVCVMIGASIVGVVNYFGGPRKVSLLRFGAPALAGFVFLVAALFALRKPWHLETFTRQFLKLVAFIYAGLMLGWWAQYGTGAAHSGGSVMQMIIGTLSFQGATLVLVAFFLREHQVAWTEGFGFAHDRLRAVSFGIVAACAFLPIGLGLQWLSGEIMTRLPVFPIEPQEQQAVQTLRVATSWTHRIALGVVTVLVAPIAEELLFRGVLYTWIKQIGYRRLAWWLSCILFALMHFNMMTFLPLLVLAFVLTALYEKTGNLLAPITAHALFNAVNLVRLLLMDKQLS